MKPFNTKKEANLMAELKQDTIFELEGHKFQIIHWNNDYVYCMRLFKNGNASSKWVTFRYTVQTEITAGIPIITKTTLRDPHNC